MSLCTQHPGHVYTYTYIYIVGNRLWESSNSDHMLMIQLAITWKFFWSKLIACHVRWTYFNSFQILLRICSKKRIKPFTFSSADILFNPVLTNHFRSFGFAFSWVTMRRQCCVHSWFSLEKFTIIIVSKFVTALTFEKNLWTRLLKVAWDSNSNKSVTINLRW